jgi:erythromycin esterase-like protein
MTKNTFLLFVFMLLLTDSHAQAIENQWLDKNYYEINPDAKQQNFSDLQFLKSELKDKRIVAIGEQTHKDGSSFDARNRIIRFLISEMGYEAILFEAGMFDVAYGSNLSSKNKNYTMRLFNYESSTASKDWSKVLDAVFFIDEMKPIDWIK